MLHSSFLLEVSFDNRKFTVRIKTCTFNLLKNFEKVMYNLNHADHCT